MHEYQQATRFFLKFYGGVLLILALIIILAIIFGG